LAFVYILLTVIVALTVPLAINLARRAGTELETNAVVNAQSVAATLDPRDLSSRAELDEAISLPVGFDRVIITDETGLVLADSDGTDLGVNFANEQRPEITQALVGKPYSNQRFSDELGEDILVAAAPVWQNDSVIGTVRVTRDVGDVTRAIRITTAGLVLVGIAALAAGIVIAFGLAGSLASPMQRLVETAGRLGRGDLEARSGALSGPREMRELAGSFDEMAERLERAVRSQREFVANASHQLRTPLTGMKLRLERAIADAREDDVREGLVAADREVDRMAAIVDRLLLMARRIEEGEATITQLDDSVRSALDRWEGRATHSGSTLTSAGVHVAAVVNPGDVDQVLDVLLDNAITHAPGAIEVETGAQDGRVFFSVRDHGPGIPTEEHPRVTERFYRGKGVTGSGSGLGLAIARELTETWGGSLAVESPSDGGTLILARFRPSITDPDEPR
jgi:signal transduction histidine kinase